MAIYVSPADMQGLYDEQILIQATNYSDRRADTINLNVLENACNVGDRIVDGYLLGLGIPLEHFSDEFKEILKVHAARIAMEFLAGTDPQIQEQAKQAIDWLKSLTRLSAEAIRKLITDEDAPPISSATRILPTVEFDEGRRWGVTF